MDYIEELINDKKLLCFDCSLPYPNYTSINNGIFLCFFCADIHKKQLDNSISKIIRIEKSKLSHEQVIYLVQGGNQRLNDYLSTYDLISNTDSGDSNNKIVKYRTRAAYMYRLILENEVCNNYYEKFSKPSYDYGRELIPLNIP